MPCWQILTTPTAKIANIFYMNKFSNFFPDRQVQHQSAKLVEVEDETEDETDSETEQEKMLVITKRAGYRNTAGSMPAVFLIMHAHIRAHLYLRFCASACARIGRI